MKNLWIDRDKLTPYAQFVFDVFFGDHDRRIHDFVEEELYKKHNIDKDGATPEIISQTLTNDRDVYASYFCNGDFWDFLKLRTLQEIESKAETEEEYFWIGKLIAELL